MPKEVCHLQIVDEEYVNLMSELQSGQGCISWRALGSLMVEACSIPIRLASAPRRAALRIDDIIKE